MDAPQPDSAQDGGLYPMRLVTRLTGLSADTIRAWERRYAAIEPRRSAGNTRRFSAEDVRRLVLLRDATSRGHSISSIAKLSIEELERLVGAGSEANLISGGTASKSNPHPIPSVSSTSGITYPSMAGGSTGSVASDRGLQELRQDYMGAVARFDARRAHEILMRAATFLDHRELVFGVVVPLVHDVGIRWANGEFGVAQEQMVSSQLRSVVTSMLRFSPPRPDVTQILLTTPPGHRHEFGVLVAALLAATKGLDPLYLGPDLPYEELKWAVRMSKAEVVILSIARDLTPPEAQELPTVVEQLARDVEVWVGLPHEHVLTRTPPVARLFHDFESFDAALALLVR